MVDEFFRLDFDTRKGVQNISLPKAELERLHAFMSYYCKVDCSEHIRCLREIFPALKHVHTTWKLHLPWIDSFSFFRDVVRRFFEKDDIELHAPLPPDEYNGYFTGLEDDEIFNQIGYQFRENTEFVSSQAEYTTWKTSPMIFRVGYRFFLRKLRLRVLLEMEADIGHSRQRALVFGNQLEIPCAVYPACDDCR